MNIEDLYQWSIEHNVEQRTIEGFHEYINNLIKDSYSRVEQYFGTDYDPHLLKVTPYKVSLVIGRWPTLEHNYVLSYARIQYKTNDLGIYKLVLTLNGEDEDDYWMSHDD